MKSLFAVGLSLALMIGNTAHAAPLPAADSQGHMLPSLAPMVERVTPGVVNIATRSRVLVEDNPLLRDPFFRRFLDIPSMPRERITQSLGSGVVVDAAKGYVLTNAHVINKADEITVTLFSGRNLAAKLVGVDTDADIAVIQIPAEGLTAVPLAGTEKLRVGDFVVAVGNPFGLGQTVTSGIISALGRSGLGIEGVEDFIQTDASINPGNSGGALVNLRGELVGINTAIYAPSGGNVGIGFAIPINMARDIMQQLITYGKVRRGRLGIMIQDLTPELARAFNLPAQQGAIIARVVSGSAADRAGVRPGDIVVTANGRPVRDGNDLRNAIGLARVGEKLVLEVLRDGKRLTLQTIVDAPEPERRSSGPSSRLGGAVIGAIPEGSPWFGKTNGLLVLDVESGSRAWNAGLRQNDLVMAVNRQPLRTQNDLDRSLKRSANNIVLSVRRGNQGFYVVLR